MRGNKGILPDGVHLAPDMQEYLERALEAVKAGLLVAAWKWTEKARAQLDRLTDGQGDDMEAS